MYVIEAEKNAWWEIEVNEHSSASQNEK